MLLEHLPIGQRDFNLDLHIPCVIRLAGITNHYALAEQLDQVGGEATLVGKGGDSNLAIKQRGGRDVLETELALEPGAWGGAVGILNIRCEDTYSRMLRGLSIRGCNRSAAAITKCVGYFEGKNLIAMPGSTQRNGFP